MDENRAVVTAEGKVAETTAAQSVENVKVGPGHPDYIPTKEKWMYGIGALMDGGGVALMSCVMLNYMTSLGIAAAVASTIILVAKFWDAVSDPLMGFISDNTRSRWGRRKPYMFFGGIALLFGLLLLFMPIRDWGVSVGGFTAYMIVMYLLWNTLSTITQVPYCSLASDISPNFRERNNANTIKLVFSAAAAGISYVLPLLLLEAYTEPEAAMLPAMDGVGFWLTIAIVFGVLFGGGLVLAAIFVKERITPPKQREKFHLKQFVKDYAVPYKNKSFRWHIGMYAAAFMCMDIISALAVYYATDVWKGKSLFDMEFSSMFIVAPLMVAAVLAFPVVRWLMSKKSKQFAFRIGLPFYIVGGIMMAVMDPEWTPPIVVPIVSFIMGFGFGGAQMMPWIIFPDTVDVAEFATGVRNTGTYSGMMTLIRKVAGALGVGMVGWIMTGAGYISSETAGEVVPQPESALLAIRLMMGISIVILIGFALFCSLQFKVTDKKLQRMRYYIEKVKEGGLQSLTAEETAERNAMVAELYGKVDPHDAAAWINEGLGENGAAAAAVVEPTEEK